MNGSLNVPPHVMTDQQALERREGGQPDERFADTLDRLGIDVFLGTDLPVLSRPNRLVVSTTTHLEREPEWMLVFRTPRSAVYVRATEKGAENRARVASYYAERDVPFDPETGFDVGRVMREGPRWAVENGLLPTHASRLVADAQSRDPGRRRAAREHLASLYATLGWYDRAVTIDRSLLAADPRSLAAARRLVWSLLHDRRYGEAAEEAERLRAIASADDGLSRALVETAIEASRSPGPEVAARVAVLPILTPLQARQVLTGLREPAARVPERVSQH